MNKKIIAMLVILMLSITTLTAFAALPITSGSDTVVGANSSIRMAIVEENENLVTVTLKLVGDTKTTAIAFVAKYDKAKVTPCNADATTLITTDQTTEASMISTGFMSAPGKGSPSGISPQVLKHSLATPYFGIGYALAMGSYYTSSTGSDVTFVKFNFKKVTPSTVVDINTFDWYVYGTTTKYGTKINYNSSAWAPISGLTGPVVDATAFSKTFTAATPAGFNVDYVENGGSAVTDLTLQTALANPLPTPTKDGYTFAGWYTDAGLNTAAVAGATISSNTTLYAKWTLNTYSVTYNTNGGVAVDTLTGVTALADPLPTTTKDRYNFVGWYTDAGLNTAAVAGATISSNTTLYAKWEVKPVTELPIAGGEVAIGDGTGSKDSADNLLMYKDKVTGLPKAIDTFVVSIPAKVPASVTELNINDTEFGIIFGGQKFKSLSTWAGLNLNQGKYFIKLVDPTGILTGKTFKAKTYFGAQVSGEISITIN